MNKIVLIIAAILAVTLTASAEKSGKEAYEISCKSCHGEKGTGGDPAAKPDPNIPVLAPNITILKEDYAKAQFKAILEGKRKGKGSESMVKALKESKLSEKEIQAALEYALKLEEGESKHKGFGDKTMGQARYVICATCHGQNGEGYINPAIPAPRIQGQSDIYIVEMVKNFKAGHRGNDTPGGMQMKAMSMTLATDDDIKNVAAYIRSLKKK